MYDYSKLCGRIIEKYGSRMAFAKAVGIGVSALSDRLNNKTPFRQSEIRKIASADFLDIPETEIGTYFFTLSVLKMRTEE